MLKQTSACSYLSALPPDVQGIAITSLAICLSVHLPWLSAWLSVLGLVLSSLVFFFSVSLPVCLVWLRLASVHVRKGLCCYQDFLSKQL